MSEKNTFAGFNLRETQFQQLNGHESALIGVVERCGMPPVLCYNKDLVLRNLREQGKSELKSLEVLSNILDTENGTATPCFISLDRTERTITRGPLVSEASGMALPEDKMMDKQEGNQNA